MPVKQGAAARTYGGCGMGDELPAANERQAMTLKPNLGNLDMIVRIVVGVALVLLMATGEIGAWGLIGLVLIVTGTARYCPLYRLFGLGTARKARHPHGDPAAR